MIYASLAISQNVYSVYVWISFAAKSIYMATIKTMEQSMYPAPKSKVGIANYTDEWRDN